MVALREHFVSADTNLSGIESERSCVREGMRESSRLATTVPRRASPVRPEATAQPPSSRIGGRAIHGQNRSLRSAKRLEAVCDAIDSRLADRSLDGAAIARASHMPRSTLYRLLAPFGGVGRFVIRRRLG